MADDVEILFPQREVELSTGESVTVNEFSLLDGLKVDAFAGPLINDLHALFEGAQIEDVSTALIDAAFGRHADIVIRALSIATGKPVEWFESVNDGDGQALVHTLWAVNNLFFIRRLVTVHQAKHFHSQRRLQS